MSLKEVTGFQVEIPISSYADKRGGNGKLCIQPFARKDVKICYKP